MDKPQLGRVGLDQHGGEGGAEVAAAWASSTSRYSMT